MKFINKTPLLAVLGLFILSFQNCTDTTLSANSPEPTAQESVLTTQLHATPTPDVSPTATPTTTPGPTATPTPEPSGSRCKDQPTCIEKIMTTTYASCARYGDGKYSCWSWPFSRTDIVKLNGIPPKASEFGGHTFTYSFLTESGGLFVANLPQNPVQPEHVLDNVVSIAGNSAGSNWRSCALTKDGQVHCAHLYQSGSGFAAHPWRQETFGGAKATKISISEAYLAVLLDNDDLVVYRYSSGGDSRQVSLRIENFSTLYQDFTVSMNGVFLIGKQASPTISEQKFGETSSQTLGLLEGEYDSMTSGWMHVCVLPKAKTSQGATPKCFGKIRDATGVYTNEIDISQLHIENVVQMSAGYFVNCFLTVNSKVYCSGINKRNALGTVDAGNAALLANPI